MQYFSSELRERGSEDFDTAMDKQTYMTVLNFS